MPPCAHALWACHACLPGHVSARKPDQKARPTLMRWPKLLRWPKFALPPPLRQPLLGTSELFPTVFPTSQGSPELLACIKRHVVIATFRKHMLAFTRANDRVYGREDGKPVSKDSSTLVVWYVDKLKVTKAYDEPEKVAKIVLLQRNIRSYLQRIRYITLLEYA